MVVPVARPNDGENIVGAAAGVNPSDESPYNSRRPQTVHILTVTRRVALESLPSHIQVGILSTIFRVL